MWNVILAPQTAVSSGLVLAELLKHREEPISRIGSSLGRRSYWPHRGKRTSGMPKLPDFLRKIPSSRAHCMSCWLGGQSAGTRLSSPWRTERHTGGLRFSLLCFHHDYCPQGHCTSVAWLRSLWHPPSFTQYTYSLWEMNKWLKQGCDGYHQACCVLSDIDSDLVQLFQGCGAATGAPGEVWMGKGQF
jgi:hypothetical protein